MAYKFNTVPRHRVNSKRAIGFLESEDDDELDAKAKFDTLDRNKERDVRKKFDAWIDDIRNDNWFHGWPNDLAVKECFSFRWEERGRKHNRFYGFLCHPQPKTNPPFQVCVLTYHDVKNSWETNRKLLTDSMLLRRDAEVQMAISMIFGDTPPEKEKIQ